MQKIILNRTRENDDNSSSQYNNNKSFDNSFNRNHQSDKVRHFNKFEKSNKSNDGTHKRITSVRMSEQRIKR